MQSEKKTSQFSELNFEMEQIVAEAGVRMSAEIRRAMQQGEVEFRDMAERIALDMAKLLLKQLLSGMQSQNLSNNIGGGGANSNAQFSQMLASLLQQGSRYS